MKHALGPKGKHGDNQSGDMGVSSTRMVMSQLQEVNFWVETLFFWDGLANLVGGLNPSEKYEFVNWDDDIPNVWKNKSHVPNHQPVTYAHKISNHTCVPNYISIYT